MIYYGIKMSMNQGHILITHWDEMYLIDISLIFSVFLQILSSFVQFNENHYINYNIMHIRVIIHLIIVDTSIFHWKMRWYKCEYHHSDWILNANRSSVQSIYSNMLQTWWMIMGINKIYIILYELMIFCHDIYCDVTIVMIVKMSMISLCKWLLKDVLLRNNIHIC